MSNPAFIVDGYTEKNIIHRICPGQPIRRTDLNGKRVTVQAISKKIASLIRLLGNRYFPIIILVDREERDITFDLMATQILEGIRREGVEDPDIRIGIADRMIENWITADWEILSGSSLNAPVNPDKGNGTTAIRNIKGSYDKTTDGVEFFLNARQQILYKNSKSYKYFIDKLKGIPCAYLDFER